MRIIEASNAAAARDRASCHDVDLILMNLRMPWMDSIDAMPRLRQRRDAKARAHRHHHGERGDRTSGRLEGWGADDLIHKLLTVGSLHDAIGRLMVQPSAARSTILH